FENYGPTGFHHVRERPLTHSHTPFVLFPRRRRWVRVSCICAPEGRLNYVPLFCSRAYYRLGRDPGLGGRHHSEPENPCQLNQSFLGPVGGTWGRRKMEPTRPPQISHSS